MAGHIGWLGSGETIMATDKRILVLAAGLARKYADDYAQYLAECEQDRRVGHRPHFCEHGADMWTDYDNICGPCEDGVSMRLPMARRLRALDNARERVAEADALMRWAYDAIKLGMGEVIDLKVLSRRFADLMEA